MGNSRRKKEIFFQNHPICCFCGQREAVEIDHLPSRACFDDRVFPDGFEFPSCSECNRGTSNEEQFIAMLSYTLRHFDDKKISAKLSQYINGVGNNSDLLEKIKIIKKIESGGGVIELPPEIQKICNPVFIKWAKAFFYRDTGKILCHNRIIDTTFLSNAQIKAVPPILISHKKSEIFANGKSLDHQMQLFGFCDSEKMIGCYGVAFRRSFFAVMVISEDDEM
jgi:hypothetical protein